LDVSPTRFADDDRSFSSSPVSRERGASFAAVAKARVSIVGRIDASDSTAALRGYPQPNERTVVA
jgi:hypothetical protein